MKISKRLGKLVAAVMAALIINIAVFSPALPVQAAEAAEATTAVYPLIEAILEILGIASGLGASYEGMDGTSEMFADLQDQWTAGESLQYGGYDFTNRDDVLAYLDSVITTYNNHISGEEVNSYLMSLDAKSFAATGTLISKTNLAALETFKDYVLGTTAEALEDEVEDVWRVIMNNGDSDGDGNSDDELNFKITNMIMNALLAGAATDADRVGNEWLLPVSVSNWSSMQLFKVHFSYNGSDCVAYHNDYFDFINDGKMQRVVFDKPVFIVFATKTSDSSMYMHIISKDNYKYAFVNYTNGIMDALNWRNNGGLNEYGCYASYLSFSKPLVSGFEYVLNPVSYGALCGSLSEAINNGLSLPKYTDSADSINVDVRNALDLLNTRNVTRNNIRDLADALTAEADISTGTQASVRGIADVISSTALSLPEAVPGTDTDVEAGDYTGVLGQILEQLLELPSAITGDLSDILEDIKAETASIGDTLNPPTEPNNGHSNDFTIFINGLICLILILLKLLMIFFHCMEFIIAIFNIQAGTAFLPEEMVMGLDYIKSLEIPGIGMSVYGFMLGLVYIFILFYAIRTLRMNINNMKMPGRR